MTSPSCTMYSFPSRRTCPFSRAAGQLPGGEQILAAHHLGADEIALDIGVDGAGGFDGGSAAANRPGAHFRLARGKKRDQSHQIVCGADKAVQPWLLSAVGRQQFGRLRRRRVPRVRLRCARRPPPPRFAAARAISPSRAARPPYPVCLPRRRRGSGRRASAAAKGT